MNGSRLPRVYCLFVVLEAVQLALFYTVASVPVSPGAAGFVLALLVGLGYGFGLVWGLLVAMNGIALLAAGGIALSSGPGILWANVAVLILTSLALETALLSPSMRQHIRSRRRDRTPDSPAV